MRCMWILWLNGENLLRDFGGSYSYADSEAAEYFSGVRGHNTVQFDGREQMPRLSRFLFGNWLTTQEVQPITENAEGVACAAAYRDRHGAYHRRSLLLSGRKLQVRD